jgi:hypothetical protein
LVPFSHISISAYNLFTVSGGRSAASIVR